MIDSCFCSLQSVCQSSFIEKRRRDFGEIQIDFLGNDFAEKFDEERNSVETLHLRTESVIDRIDEQFFGNSCLQICEELCDKLFNILSLPTLNNPQIRTKRRIFKSRQFDGIRIFSVSREVRITESHSRTRSVFFFSFKFFFRVVGSKKL